LFYRMHFKTLQFHSEKHCSTQVLNSSNLFVNEDLTNKCC
jgi:hypothetical protein